MLPLVCLNSHFHQVFLIFVSMNHQSTSTIALGIPKHVFYRSVTSLAGQYPVPRVFPSFAALGLFNFKSNPYSLISIVISILLSIIAACTWTMTSYYPLQGNTLYVYKYTCDYWAAVVFVNSPRMMYLNVRRIFKVINWSIPCKLWGVSLCVLFF